MAAAQEPKLADVPKGTTFSFPFAKSKVSNLTFGGENMDILDAAWGDKMYSRKVKVKGANAFEAPFKPNPPRL